MSGFEVHGHKLACSQSVAARSAYDSLARLTDHYLQLKIRPRTINLYTDQLQHLRSSLERSGFDVGRQPLTFRGFTLREVAR